MPYYIYKIKPFSQLEKLFEFDAFKEASARAKLLRGSPSAESPGSIKVIFADNELQAEDLLFQVRTAGPRGDE